MARGSAVRDSRQALDPMLVVLRLEFLVRIKPPVPVDQAYQYLALNAALVWGLEDAAKMDAHLQGIATAMAEVSALEIADDVEPIFGEDHALDPEGVV